METHRPLALEINHRLCESNIRNTYGYYSSSKILEFLVLYESQYENELGKLWVRPIAMFNEKIIVDGKEVERFKLIKGSSERDSCHSL